MILPFPPSCTPNYVLQGSKIYWEVKEDIRPSMDVHFVARKESRGEGGREGRIRVYRY